MPAKKSFQEGTAVAEPMLASHPLVRAANFHNTPRARGSEFEEQLRHWSAHFSSVNEHELDDYLKTGVWPKAKPGLIVAMYNGYRNTYDVMRPLVERYGFVGWFFVPTAFVGTPAAEQADFVTTRTLKVIPNEYSDGRVALNWDELKELDRHHVIACHTRNHSKIVSQDPAVLEGEVVGPQRDFEAHLGHSVRSFASLSGAAYGDNAVADRLIDAAKYQFVFSNLKIQRLCDVNASAYPANGSHAKL